MVERLIVVLDMLRLKGLLIMQMFIFVTWISIKEMSGRKGCLFGICDVRPHGIGLY